LNEILARIDAPRLNGLHIALFNIIFDTPQLFQFISRSPTLRAPEKGHIEFNPKAITVGFPSQTSDYGALSVQISFTPLERQLSSLEQVCACSLPSFFTLKDLYVFEDRTYRPGQQESVENDLWLDLSSSFVAVKNLYLSEEFVPHIAPALEELVGIRTKEVFPTLRNIFLEGFQPSGPLHEGIKKFVATRCLIRRPVAISRWDWKRRRAVHVR
jgi:hypothetical protein